KIEVRTGDELEALGDEFNRMTEQLRESYANLEQKVEDRTRDLTEALEQQTATSEILRVISSSPTDVQPVLDAIIESAARLCEADNAAIFRVDGDVFRLAAAYGSAADWIKTHVGTPFPMDRSTVAGQALLDRRTVQVHDLMATDGDALA